MYFTNTSLTTYNYWINRLTKDGRISYLNEDDKRKLRQLIDTEVKSPSIEKFINMCVERTLNKANEEDTL